MGASFLVSGAGSGLGDMGAMSEVKWAVFAFGLVAFGFLGMGAVTIAVDSYGPVTDNAQSVYELSTIEDIPNVSNELKKHYGFAPGGTSPSTSWKLRMALVTPSRPRPSRCSSVLLSLARPR